MIELYLDTWKEIGTGEARPQNWKWRHRMHHATGVLAWGASGDTERCYVGVVLRASSGDSTRRGVVRVRSRGGGPRVTTKGLLVQLFFISLSKNLVVRKISL